MARQPLVDPIGIAEEAYLALPDERFGGEPPKELDVRISNQHRVVLRSRDRGQLDHLLLNPTPHRRERPAQVELDVNKRHAHECARQEVILALDMRTWTGEPTEQFEVRPGHDNVMLDRGWGVVEHRP